MLLQLARWNGLLLRDLRARGEVPVGPVSTDLEPTVDRAVERLRRERARTGSPGLRIAAAVDRAIRTDRPEHFDNPMLPPAHRRKLAQGLHRHNRLVGAYRRFLSILAGPLRAAAARRPGPVRCLELASGSGELAIALDAEARERGVAVEITGSDLAPSSVAEATERASGTGVQFLVLDALDLAGIPDGSFDVIFIAQSAHHFTPGQVARIVAAGTRAATTAFVLIDGYRALWMFPLLGVTATLAGPVLYHDTLITARKFYSEAELRLIAELAVGPDRATVRTSWPGWSVLEVRRQAACGP
jgi:2-polyprenyl-3-methyl-5-hydroxy-6-metoxy-1,4-benzoquinol methylase